MDIEFYKYQGTGNDFILIDDRDEIFNLNDSTFIRLICTRRFGVGADGLILLRNNKDYDFEMIFFNSTGEQSTFCGNGGRCIVAFAKKIGIIEEKCEFLAYDGVHVAEIDNDMIHLRMKDVENITLNYIDNTDLLDQIVLDTGSPHAIQFCKDLETFEVMKLGKKISHDSKFGEYGINVNFVEIKNQYISIRTYERGDEMESLSCGTGSVATAIALHYISSRNILYYLEENQYEVPEIKNEVSIQTIGGELQVCFTCYEDSYQDIWLKGEAKCVFHGRFSC